MEKAVQSPRHAHLCRILRAAREEAGLRQVDLADRLGEPQSFISKYESGERRLDLVELEQVCHAIGVGLDEIVQRFLEVGNES